MASLSPPENEASGLSPAPGVAAAAALASTAVAALASPSAQALEAMPAQAGLAATAVAPESGGPQVSEGPQVVEVGPEEINRWKRGFTPQAEIWNGRMAMLGLSLGLALLLLVRLFGDISGAR